MRLAWCVGSVLVAGAAWLAPVVPLWVATGATGFAVGALLWFGLLGADSWIEGGIVAVILAVLGALLPPTVERVAERIAVLRQQKNGALRSRLPCQCVRKERVTNDERSVAGIGTPSVPGVAAH